MLSDKRLAKLERKNPKIISSRTIPVFLALFAEEWLILRQNWAGVSGTKGWSWVASRINLFLSPVQNENWGGGREENWETTPLSEWFVCWCDLSASYCPTCALLSRKTLEPLWNTKSLILQFQSRFFQRGGGWSRVSSLGHCVIYLQSVPINTHNKTEAPSHRAQSTSQQAYSNNGTHCGQWERTHSLQANIKGFACKFVCKSANATCVNGAQLCSLERRCLLQNVQPSLLCYLPAVNPHHKCTQRKKAERHHHVIPSWRWQRNTRSRDKDPPMGREPGKGGPPRRRRVQDSIRPFRLTAALGLKTEAAHAYLPAECRCWGTWR